MVLYAEIVSGLEPFDLTINFLDNISESVFHGQEMFLRKLVHECVFEGLVKVVWEGLIHPYNLCVLNVFDQLKLVGGHCLFD